MKTKAKKQDTKGKGRIQVTIQREDRLKVITLLAETVKRLAYCLDQNPSIAILNNVISDVDVGINVDNADDIDKTEIKEVAND